MTIMKPFNESAWPKDQAIKIVKGSGENALAVFEDPNCGYCQKLDRQTLAHLDNLTVYVFLYPFLGEDSILMSERILASADPGKAFLDWMLRGIEPKEVNVPEDVKQILRQNIGLALSLNIMGTPAIYTEDGAGPLAFVTAKELQRHLDAVKK